MVVAVETMTPDLQLVDQPEKTASQQVREWARDRIDGETRVKAPAIAAEALAAIGTDELLIQLGRSQFYRLVLEVIGSTRDSQRASSGQQSPDELKAKWEGFLEHAGEQHIVVTSMRYDDILLAVAEQRKRVAPVLAEIEFMVNIGKGLKGTNLTVGEKFTPEEIEQIRQAANRKYKVER